MSKKVLSVCIVVMLILGLTFANAFAANNTINDQVKTAFEKACKGEIEQTVNKQMDAYHWKLVNSDYTQVSNTVNNNGIESVWLVNLTHKLNYSKAESVPVLKGKMRYLNESNGKLTTAEKSLVQNDIVTWKNQLQDYISNDQYLSEYVKITAQTNNQNEIIPGSIQVFIENGNDYSPADEFIKVPDISTQENNGYESLKTKVTNVESSSASISPNLMIDGYNATTAKNYANTWVKNTSLACQSGSTTVQNKSNYNSAYNAYTCNDCANFVSQCLYAGGIPKDSTWTPYTSTWIQAYTLVNYMVNHGYAYQLTYSTVPVGGIAKDNNVQHVYFVVYNDGSTVKVNCHTNDRYQMALGSGYSATYYSIHYWIN